MTADLRLRNAKAEDREQLHAIAKQWPGLPFPDDVLAWPTMECFVVETGSGEVVGFGYIEAVPEAHFVMKRGGADTDTKRHAVALMHHAAGETAEALRLPVIRYPVSPGLPGLSSWIQWLLGFPNIRLDPRIHLAMVRPKGE